ncbi:MAG: AAA family ATPase [Rhodothermaceae bacterium]|nr:AAA family ATPase [Rhodothermaceae bacterium]
MFKKISKLKKFGIFRNFSWDEDTPDLARFNLIYGWNRSGKTTLSRVFAACEKGSIDFHEYPKGGEFELEVKDGSDVDHNSCQNIIHPVRVFNRDFVEENVFFDSRGSRTEPITYVGKEDIESAIELQELQNTHQSLESAYNAAQQAWRDKSDQEDYFRRSTAKQIKNTLGIHANDGYRNYDKGKLKDRIRQIGIINFQKLSPADYESQLISIRSDQPEFLDPLPEYSFKIQFKDRDLRGFTEISEEISALLSRSVVAETVEWLKDDDELNRWAEEGFRLHEAKDEKEKCLFCQNDLEKGFLGLLSNHFSEDYKNLQENIDSVIQCLNRLKKERLSRENQKLSTELRGRYKNKEGELNAILEEINDWIDQAIAKLNEKHGNPLQAVERIQPPVDYGSLCNDLIGDLNQIIQKHNLESRDHAEVVRKAKERLENHMIAAAIEEEQYDEISSSLDSLTEDKETTYNELESNRRGILDLEQKTSDIGVAVAEINRYLEEFFGRNEIVLGLDSSRKGYVIRRNGEPASNLSEGEKNAIAFSYFIVKTREKGFDIEDGIIVIDDPVSSFDSNFTYHCFSLVKNNFNEAKQLILLTHNFEVFNLVKNRWFSLKNQRVEKRNNLTTKEKQKNLPCGFFMIRNEVKNRHRYARVERLDETLRKFDSEYQFLFSELNQFLDKPGDDYADYYRIGNMARRFFETYANLKIPTTGDPRNKLDQLCKDCVQSQSGTVSETEKERLYRLINEYSHLRDIDSALKHKDRSEIKDAIRILIKVVKGSDERHFESLTDCLSERT